MRARRHHVGGRPRARDDRRQRGDRAPAPFGPRPPARFLRPGRDRADSPRAWPRGNRARGGSTTTAPSPPSWSTPSSPRTPTSSPSPRTCTTRRWRPSGRCACRRCSTPPRTTSRPCTCPSSAAPSGTRTRSASIRRRNAPSSSGCTRWRSVPRSCSVSGWVTPRPPAGPAARCGAGRAPLHRQRRACRRAQGLQDAGLVLRDLQGASPRTARPGPGRARLGRHRSPSRHRRDGSGGRGRQVGHHARRARWRSRPPRSSRSPSW